MFKRNDDARPFTETQNEIPDVEPPATAARSVAAIGASIVVRGDITGDEDLLIQGRVEGTLQLPKNDLIVGPDGKVKADLKAMKVEVQGEVTGGIEAAERVIIKRSGRVEGDIIAPRVVLEDGCSYKGSVDMSARQEEPARGGPALKKAAAKSTAGKVAVSQSVGDNERDQVAAVARASSTG